MRRGVRLGGTNERGAAPVRDVDAGDRRLLETIEQAFDRVRRRSGQQLVCRAGCDACCHGPFPITALDARRLRAGIAAAEPERAQAIRSRAGAVVERLRDGFPGDVATGRPVDDPDVLDAFFERHAGLACPVLDPVSGRCELYESRPVACRLHGPPSRFRGVDVPPCDLCFREADAAEIEACRLDTGTEPLEASLLEAVDDAPGAEWATLIAWAVCAAD